jgi:hypothetical protein
VAKQMSDECAPLDKKQCIVIVNIDSQFSTLIYCTFEPMYIKQLHFHWCSNFSVATCK